MFKHIECRVVLEYLMKCLDHVLLIIIIIYNYELFGSCFIDYYHYLELRTNC